MQKFSTTIDAIADEAGCSLRTTFYRHFRKKYSSGNVEIRSFALYFLCFNNIITGL